MAYTSSMLLYSTLEARGLASSRFGSSEAGTWVISTFDEPSTTFFDATKSCNISTNSRVTSRSIVGSECDWVGVFGGVCSVCMSGILGLTINEGVDIVAETWSSSRKGA